MEETSAQRQFSQVGGAAHEAGSTLRFVICQRTSDTKFGCSSLILKSALVDLFCIAAAYTQEQEVL
ncbi:hypothetical protein WKK05_15930 [Nostoc sp. UHCC 0302]|uniref:hypothetical protein n=1 Tax=Nostoc sp. UHCC 0302 TaxID=3134896 RepID=UPI00311CA8F7